MHRVYIERVCDGHSLFYMVLEKTIYCMMQQIAERNMGLKNNKQSAKIVMYDRKKNKQFQIITFSLPNLFQLSISHIVFYNVLIVMVILTYWLSSQNDVSPLVEHIATIVYLLLFIERGDPEGLSPQTKSWSSLTKLPNASSGLLQSLVKALQLFMLRWKTWKYRLLKSHKVIQ